MLACTERQFVRTYPKGSRMDSTNFSPLPMWRCGVQMVALNFQYSDIFMHLNQGFFRLNGGCGYVLKPALMRREDPGGGTTPFDPEMQTPHPDVPPIDLEIEVRDLMHNTYYCYTYKFAALIRTEAVFVEEEMFICGSHCRNVRDYSRLHQHQDIKRELNGLTLTY